MSDMQEQSKRKPLSVVPGFELASGESCVLDAEGHCITCADEALPARVLQIDEELGTALVEVGDEPVEVDITLVDGAVPGGWLLVHGGVAIANIAGADEGAIHRAPTNEANNELLRGER